MRVLAQVITLGLLGSLLQLGASADSPEPFEEARATMVREQIRARGVLNAEVLRAMLAVPRHRFVPEAVRLHAYEDRPLPIGFEQTISQPYIVAIMTELAKVKKGDRVLEVGTGSGYQAAVLAELGAVVYSIEIVDALAKGASALLRQLGYQNVKVRSGDGYLGWPEQAPFDAVIVTAAPPKVPPPLKEQLKVGGRLVIPVGKAFQRLEVYTRTNDGYNRDSVLPVRFVPMTGKAQDD